MRHSASTKMPQPVFACHIRDTRTCLEYMKGKQGIVHRCIMLDNIGYCYVKRNQ